DRFRGTSIWKQEKLHARSVTAPASIGDYIVVGDLEGYLHWMSKISGEFVSRIRLSDERIIVSPIVVGKTLYAYCSDGTLAAYSYR
ncbi:MAG: outer membrane protein assembly factor BamB, partial [Gammaproteobacteria bacterium]|nr:outer membrane protein assembly factor BamB [Gammaproteobacteria bacterium]